MEDLRKRINVRLINNAKRSDQLTSRPTYITHKIFGKDYAAIHEIKPVLILDRAIYVGFTVIELSKWKMYDFHYNSIKTNFNAELFFTDTDSLAYEIKSENVYEEFFGKMTQAKMHKIGTYEIDKIPLSCFDDKRYVLDDGIHTLAYFHKDSDNQKKNCDHRDIVIMEKDCDNGKLL